ncbi:sensor histidine kinase [Taklimakanibacter deserti]|uniref:sensor histidine kinase n=1 Tax=Taklimakanibacter deserti TaxID=2267839 RepID=UPI000E65A8C5
MRRISLAARITLIVIMAIMAVWIAALGSSYRSHDFLGEDARPQPRQIAALLDLIERAAPEQRPLVLAASSSNLFAARLAAGERLASDSGEGRPADADILKIYEAALGGRAFRIMVMPASPAERRYPRLFGRVANALEFRIALKTGETLIISTRSPLALSRFGVPVGFGAGMLGTFIALIALITMHRALRPLRKLAAAVDRMEPSGTPLALAEPKGGAPEIRGLIAAFNRLQARLSQLLHARMALLGGISHDVRSFATRLRLRADLIPDERERERAIADISDMIRLLDDALLASRAGAGELAQELVELGEILQAEVADRQAQGSAIDLNVEFEAAEAPVLGDRLALRRIISNLTDNALKYGFAAHLKLAREGESLVLKVDDDGPGIPPNLRDMLLEPFVRLETSRSRRTGGAGLGLAVATRLIEAHDGSITIGDATSGGTRITVRLPIFVPKANAAA